MNFRKNQGGGGTGKEPKFFRYLFETDIIISEKRGDWKRVNFTTSIFG